MKKINTLLFGHVFLFFLISILTIYSASVFSSVAGSQLIFKQIIWYILGFLVALIIIRKNNNFFYKNAWLFYFIGLLLLVYVLVFAVPINNSRCWIVIPGLGSFQPSEFMKIALIFVLGKTIHDFRVANSCPTIYQEFIFILKTIFIFLVPIILTFMQPDTGAVIIYAVIYVFMMLFSGIRIRWFVFALIALLVLLGIGGYIYYFNEDLFVNLFGYSMYYRIERIFLWKKGAGLQLENALAAIGSAFLIGHGYNNTPIYFPEAINDFIFAVYASNFGFIGVFLLIGLFFSFDLLILNLLKQKTNYFNKYIVGGILGLILFQQIQNIGMTIGLFPITGITLPFISYGGSSLFSYMIIVGILSNVSFERNRLFN